MKTINTFFAVILMSTTVNLMLMPGSAHAHCDTLDGPVVKEARTAVSTGDITPLLKWVESDQEESIRAAFEHTLVVRKLSKRARELADMYFFETLVRIHRASEGAPYSGLKSNTTVDPAVALADEAIEKGSVEKLTVVLSNALSNRLSSQFNKVISSKKLADRSVEKGREYVAAYVQFTHFAEGVHGIIKGKAKHGDHK